MPDKKPKRFAGVSGRLGYEVGPTDGRKWFTVLTADGDAALPLARAYRGRSGLSRLLPA